jgi:predicted transcriptional regulator
VAEKTKTDRADWIQARVIARMRELGMTEHAVAKLVEDHVARSHVYAYLSKRASMGSHKLMHLFRAIGLTLAVAE